MDQALAQAQVAANFAEERNVSIGIQRETQIVRIQRLRYQRFVQGGDTAKDNSPYQMALEQYSVASASLSYPILASLSYPILASLLSKGFDFNLIYLMPAGKR